MIFWAAGMALTWTALQGTASLGNLIGGFILSYAILKFSSRLLVGSYIAKWKLGKSMVLLGRFLQDLVISNFRVALACISPKAALNPQFLTVPITLSTDAEIATLANLITLTPGTLSYSVSEDRKTLLIHALFGDEPGFQESMAQLQERISEASH